MFDWLGLVIAPDRPEPRQAPGAGRPDLPVGTIVRQYQPPTADLWRQDAASPEIHRLHPGWDGAKNTPCGRVPPGGLG